MLYPKIKIKKNKLKISIKSYISNIKNFIVNSINIFQSRKYFILFIKKSLHF